MFSVGRKLYLPAVVVGLVLFFGEMGPVLSQDTGPTRIPTVTRLVQRFHQLEVALIDAVTKKDNSALNGLLTEDFELRAGAAPGLPVPRGQWIDHSFAARELPHPVQMAVHEYGPVAVVSFLGEGGARGDVLIVDVWTNAGGQWKLSARYVAPAGPTRFDSSLDTAGPRKKY
jgi:hypothetical protein